MPSERNYLTIKRFQTKIEFRQHKRGEPKTQTSGPGSDLFVQKLDFVLYIVLALMSIKRLRCIKELLRM